MCSEKTSLLLYIMIAIILAALPTHNDASQQNFSSAARSNQTEFKEYRYNRYFLFFFSQDMTLKIFNDSVLNKLIEFDIYCGGENIFTSIYFGNQPFSNDGCSIFCTLNAFFSIINYDEFNASIAKGVNAGTVDVRDVNNVTATFLDILLSDVSSLLNGKYGVESLESQVIFVTDYATESLRSDNVTALLTDFQSQKNVSFIVLSSALSDTTARTYFPNSVWTIAAEYENWTAEAENPICGYHTKQYTTPLPQYDDNFMLNIYLYFSNGYIRTTQLKDVFDLLISLTQRRWLDPCRYYRYVSFKIYYLAQADDIRNNQCLLDTYLFGISPRILRFEACSLETFESFFGTNASLISSDNSDASCPVGPKMLSSVFGEFLQEKSSEKRKYLLITDVPMLCGNSYYIDSVYNRLKNYTDYSSGAPLTVISIGNKTSAKSSFYASLFPPTQTPNLYEVEDIAELLSSINNTVNFCLDSVPWLSLSESRLSQRVVWFFYLIGALTLTAALFALVGIIFLMKRRKRLQEVRQIRERTKTNTSSIAATRRNTYQQNFPMSVTDPWEVSHKCLDVDYKAPIGKGAFSVVYSGFLHGKAPVLSLFPSIALQQFSDCEVAVKTLPQHSSEGDKSKFRAEVRLMKEIGYHVHLVSMLGCNCSVERPLLLMELADQDLLHWLNSSGLSTSETESNIEKTLLSIAWQISDGMSYLSSKNFLHRDLAARNVLLNKEMKAMVSDFGLCQKLDKDEQERIISGGRLPLKWIALESLQENKFSAKTDIWSFGVLLFEIFSLGQEPYVEISGKDLVTFLQAGKRLNRPIFANDQIFDLMQQCWRIDPAQRPDFSRINAYFAMMLEDSTANYGYLSTVEMEPQFEQFFFI